MTGIVTTAASNPNPTSAETTLGRLWESRFSDGYNMLSHGDLGKPPLSSNQPKHDGSAPTSALLQAVLDGLRKL